ncbi:phage major capsid protein [Sphingomonas sp.]|uniref:phage major capsid protein n=1 Tax=Sphingomonas sp. TaxID=28214 RepID=UPI002BF4E0D0|nr:phage major capsid protein [Sphingomonas sp.]HWK35115.1 phage major capsid protein [Sphingomonas sp.]
MSIISRLFGFEARQQSETRSLASSDDALLDLFGATPAASGISVTPANAMRSPAVRAAVEAISEAVGGLPLHVYERGTDNDRSRATDHPAYAILHDQANDWTDAHSFREQLTRDALLHGNGFAFINRVGGEPRELIRFSPPAVSVELDRTTCEPLYRVTGDKGQRVYDRRDILHIAAPILGDFAQGYRIVDRIALTMLRDPYSAAVSSQTRFHWRRRVGGAVVKAEAFKALKIAAS